MCEMTPEKRKQLSNSNNMQHIKYLHETTRADIILTPIHVKVITAEHGVTERIIIAVLTVVLYKYKNIN